VKSGSIRRIASFDMIGHAPHIGRLYRQSPIAGARRILLKRAVREGMGGARISGIDQIWHVEAEGYVAIDLTSALVNGHDELE
jgi:hypothetical protein